MGTLRAQQVALAAFALVPSNLLLLDEASNHLDAGTIATLTGALQVPRSWNLLWCCSGQARIAPSDWPPCAQEYDGALIAITHNPAFARSLEATHVLRVRDGQVSLAPNYGLTAADFDHTAPPVPVARAAASEQAAGPSGADNPRKVREVCSYQLAHRAPYLLSLLS